MTGKEVLEHISKCVSQCILSVAFKSVYYLVILNISTVSAIIFFLFGTVHCRSQVSSVGIATHYGLDTPRIESQWGRDSLHLSSPALRSTQPPIQWVLGLSQGVKRPGCGIDHPPPSSAKVNERVELYLYSPSGPSWPVLG
jgi:hypothetical protein